MTIPNVSTADFRERVLNAQEPVVVDFYADWCGPCRTQTPILEAFANEADSPAQVVKVDVDADPELAAQWAIRSIPTLKLFRDGDAIATRTGLTTGPELHALIAHHT